MTTHWLSKSARREATEVALRGGAHLVLTLAAGRLYVDVVGVAAERVRVRPWGWTGVLDLATGDVRAATPASRVGKAEQVRAIATQQAPLEATWPR
ncbi:MAG: hypothetical protein ACLQVI_22045 [Polyangiaceae bacterium]